MDIPPDVWKEMISTSVNSVITAVITAAVQNQREGSNWVKCAKLGLLLGVIAGGLCALEVFVQHLL